MTDEFLYNIDLKEKILHLYNCISCIHGIIIMYHTDNIYLYVVIIYLYGVIIYLFGHSTSIYF